MRLGLGEVLTLNRCPMDHLRNIDLTCNCVNPMSSDVETTFKGGGAKAVTSFLSPTVVWPASNQNFPKAGA